MANLTARIYSPERLPANQKNAISDGIDLVGKHLGGLSVQGFSTVKLPTKNGVVLPEKTGYKHMKPTTELHIFVAPLASNQRQVSTSVMAESLGFSFSKSGIVWMRHDLPDQLTTITTAHESAHAFGYVLEDAPQSIRAGSNGHCSSDGCILQSSTNGGNVSNPPNVFSDSAATTPFELSLPTDFCTPCKADMHGTVEESTANMHANRRILGGVDPRSIVKA